MTSGVELTFLSAYLGIVSDIDFPFLQDYSKNIYDVAWQKDCWWDKPVILYGDPKLKKDHPVVAFLAADGHAKSLAIYKEG